VYRSGDGGNTYQLMSSLGETETTYMDTTPHSALAYDYIVKSFDGSGNESAPSNMTSVTIP
jgi:hypothetical protein